MPYTVLEYFEDLQDGSYPYRAGDKYPRPGFAVSEKRIAELSGADNLRGIQLIRNDGTEPAQAKRTGRKKKTVE